MSSDEARIERNEIVVKGNRSRDRSPVSPPEEPKMKKNKISVQGDRAEYGSAGSSRLRSSACNSSDESSIYVDAEEESNVNLEKSVDPPTLCMDLGEQDFAKIRYFPAFVDKSLLLKTVIDDTSRILLVAPRRFGKSVNIDMLRRFFERSNNPEVMYHNRALFNGLLIEQYPNLIKDNFGKYPIILLDFKTLKMIDTYDAAFSAVRCIIHQLYDKHRYLKTSDKIKITSDKTYISQWCSELLFKQHFIEEDDLTMGLENLASFLCCHFEVDKIMVLIDEYDAICSKAIFDVNNYTDQSGNVHSAEIIIERIIGLCIATIGSVAKANSNVGRVILTGISFIMTQGLSGLNNVIPYRFQENSKYTDYYGLTQEEVSKLCGKLGRNLKFEEMTNHFNGYRGDMLSTWSVMRSFHANVIKNYWVSSGYAHNLNKALRITAFRSIISRLLGSLSNEVEINHLNSVNFENVCKLRNVLDSSDVSIGDLDIYFDSLLEQGYFKIVSTSSLLSEEVRSEQPSLIKIKIPNLEIREELSEELGKYYDKKLKLNMSLVQKCASILDEICVSDEENKQLLKKFNDTLNEIMNEVVFEAKNEATLHNLIFFIVFNCQNFKCFSEVRPAVKTLKRLDLLLVSPNVGVIIELKYDKNAFLGLTEIVENKYYEAFANPQYNPDETSELYRLLVGLNMSRDQNVTLSVLFNCLELEKQQLFQ